MDYEGVRRRGGLAWFPMVDEKECVKWEPNPAYTTSRLIKKQPREYPELGVLREVSIYEQFSLSPETIQWVQTHRESPVFGRTSRHDLYVMASFG
jgi:glucose-6-phosphate isomerase